MDGQDEQPHAAQALICSARGCRASAAYALRWRNPKIHTPERRKTWLACPDHREHLAHFLSARGFLHAVDPVTDPPVEQS